MATFSGDERLLFRAALIHNVTGVQVADESGQVAHTGIVVGVDGSSASKAAVRWATGEAAMRNEHLCLAHIQYPLTADMTPELAWMTFAEAGTEIRESQEARAWQVIDDATAIVDEMWPDRRADMVHSELLFGLPTPTLVDLSKEAQILVLGGRGQGAWHRLLLGSVSGGAAQHAHCPVAVIHEGSLATEDFDRLPVLVGVDGSPASELAVQIGFDEASWRRVDLIALHTWSDAEVSNVPSLEFSAREEAVHEILVERLAGWEERYPDVNVHRLIEWDQPARRLIEASNSAQLVVVGSRGRGGLAGMLLGSVASTVAHAARTPVIIARQG